MNQDLTILIAEDDENDVHLLRQALLKNNITDPVQICSDGQQAIDYLRGAGSYANRSQFPFPTIIFLDIKMPKKSGLDVLEWLRANPDCAVIPVIILTASREEQDIARA